MNTKICYTCEREYVPTSRHKSCPACRYKVRKKPCRDCGNDIGLDYQRCISCHNKNLARGAEGRIRHKKGYIMVKNREHPRGKSNSGYVFEHIIVMESILGRFLFEGETVHHINGQKDDNRPENLELWCKPQPTGIRAEDAYRHALEIVELYGPLFSPTTNTDS